MATPTCARRFLILALPRSRTAWLSIFLTHSNSFCFHEPLLGCSTVADLEQRFREVDTEVVGGADTGAALFLDRIVELMPDIRLAVVERPLEQCAQSLRALGDIDVIIATESLRRIQSALDDAKQRYRPLVVRFADLNDPDTARALWEHCIGEGFDPVRFSDLCRFNIEIIPEAFWARVRENQANIQALAKESPWLGE